MSTEELITCQSCLEEKPISEFPASKTAKSGHMTICKACLGAKISEGRSRLGASSTPPHLQPLNPKFADKSPRQLIAALKELITELKARGYSYRGELTYLQRIKL